MKTKNKLSYSAVLKMTKSELISSLKLRTRVKSKYSYTQLTNMTTDQLVYLYLDEFNIKKDKEKSWI